MTRVLPIVAIAACIACAGTQPAPSAPEAAQAQAAPAADSDRSPVELVSPAQAALPPVVLSGNADLECNISSKANGKQSLLLSSGQGLEFDVVVSPIVDGVVETRAPDKGGSYRFTSHLAQPGEGTLSGVGPVTFEELETKVNVELARYQQKGGPGTALRFTSADMAARGIYVEFAGRARADDGTRYAFRVTLGAPGEGSGGSVEPASDADQAPIAAKMVQIAAPMTTVVATTTAQQLK